MEKLTHRRLPSLLNQRQGLLGSLNSSRWLSSTGKDTQYKPRVIPVVIQDQSSDLNPLKRKLVLGNFKY